MDENKQTQKAGENSQQVMAQNAIINNNYGLDKEAVRVIIDSEIDKILQECQIVANETALNRLNEFKDILIPKLVNAQVLDAFKEPSIQMLFRDAEKTAICSERKLDYELLSELLIHRTKKDDITKNASIKNAIDIINYITEDALLVLTIFHSTTCFRPIMGDVNTGLELLENLFSKILTKRFLPKADEWVDNLEINKIMTFNSLGTTKRLSDYWFETFKSYTQIWIENGSDKYNEILVNFTKNNIPTDLLIVHPLNNNYYTLNILSKEMIDKITFLQTIPLPQLPKEIEDNFTNLKNVKNVTVPVQLSDIQKKVIIDIFDDETLCNNKENNNKTLFENKLKEFNTLNSINDWWNNHIVKLSIRLNYIGKVIAHTNAKNIDPTLPDLD
ncbi:MAG: hypothetical protein LBL91_05100 [Lachnospiraceae bacterium]|jgi:hypothetical protein|nr:hypothetical protein [Lachnospiraceae bacterium]